MAGVMFGSGALVIKDSAGNAFKVAELQDVSVEFSSTTKELVGSSKFAIAIAQTGAKVSGKAKFVKVDGRLFQTVLGGTSATGGTLFVDGEPQTAATSVNVANKTTFVEDFGVVDASGNPMTKVASAPTVGQYAVAAGVYTFNAAEAGKLAISYTYTTTAGSTISITNGSMGLAQTYTMECATSFQGKSLNFKFYSVSVPKLGLAFKNDDFTVQDVDFACVADGSGKVVDIYLS